MYYEMTETVKTETGAEVKAGTFVREIARDPETGKILVVKVLGGREFYVTENQINGRVH